MDQRTQPGSTHPIRVRSCLISLDTFRTEATAPRSRTSAKEEIPSSLTSPWLASVAGGVSEPPSSDPSPSETAGPMSGDPPPAPSSSHRCIRTQPTPRSPAPRTRVARTSSSPQMVVRRHRRSPSSLDAPLGPDIRPRLHRVIRGETGAHHLLLHLPVQLSAAIRRVVDPEQVSRWWRAVVLSSVFLQSVSTP